MARFEKQFDVRDPLTFNAMGLLEAWPRQAAWEARSLLEGHSSKQLKTMAQTVNSVIEDQVAYLMTLPEPRSFHAFADNPMSIAQGMWVQGPPEHIRERHGDVNLFVAASTPLHPAGIGAALPFEQWKGLAVLALWKLVDFYDTIQVIYRRLDYYQNLDDYKRNKPSAEDRLSAYRTGGPLVVEAMRACTLAAEGRMRMQLLSAMASDAERKVADALYEAEAVRRREVSIKSRAAVMVRHGKTSEHQAQALRLANSRPFQSRAAAARYALDRVEKTPGETYTYDVVYRWLKVAGWTRNDGAPTA